MKRAVLLLALALVLVTAGCDVVSAPDRASRGASITGATLTHDEAGEWVPFSIQAQKAGDLIGVDFRGNVAQGRLQIQLLDPQGKEAWSETIGPGEFVVNRATAAEQEGEYKLRLSWDGAILVLYNLMWKPFAIPAPVILPIALLSPVGMLLVALGFIVFALRQRGGWGYLLLGALFWIVTVALKFAWAIPINNTVFGELRGVLPDPIAQLVFEIYVGALTGVFEVAVTYVVLRLTPLGRVGWPKALAFAVGFGAVEAILLSVSPLAGVILGLVSPSQLSAPVLQILTGLNNPLMGLTSPWERFFTIWIHVFCNVLLFYAIRSGTLRAFWLSFAYKTLLDTIGAMAQMSGLISADALGAVWVVEAAIGILGAIAWWGTGKVKARFPAGPPPGQGQVDHADIQAQAG